MNRREFIKLTGAVGTMAATATVPRFAAQLAEEPIANVEIRGVPRGGNVWIGTEHGVTIWQGKANGETIKGYVPAQFNGDRVVFRIRKKNWLPLEFNLQATHDGSPIILACAMIRDNAYHT